MPEQVLKERNFPYSNIKLLASKRCAWQEQPASCIG
jgi:hypothetical protein